MKRYFSLLMVALFSTTMLTASVKTSDPLSEFLVAEIERMELEQELFGIDVNNQEPVSIAAVAVYELDEEVTFNFNTSDYLPENFNARKGMNDIDWNRIKLYEVEEEINIDENFESETLDVSSF